MIGRERLTFGHGRLDSVHARPEATATAVLVREPPLVNLARLETWDWGWGGLLIFSILLFFRPQDQIAALGALHASDAAAAVGLIAMVVLNLSHRLPITRMTPELWGVFALGAVLLGTTPFSYWVGGSLAVFTDYYIQVALIFLLMVNTVTSTRRIDRLCWTIVLAFGYISARVIFDYLRGVNLVEGDRAGGPIGGFFANPNDLALNLVAFLPLVMMYVKRRGPALKRFVALGIALLMFVALVFTKSRSGLMGAIVMLAAYLVVTRSLKPATVLALIVGGLLVLPALPSSYWSRMSSIFQSDLDKTGSRSERRILMEQAWRVFTEHPLTGVGAGQFQNYTDPGRGVRWRVTHNAFLQVAAELGVFGLIAFCFLVIRGFWAALWTRRALTGISTGDLTATARSGTGRLQAAAAAVGRLKSPRRGGGGSVAAAPASRASARSDQAGAGARMPSTRTAVSEGFDDRERQFLQTTSAALVACLTGWVVCAMFASVALNWTFYYLLGLAAVSRGVVHERVRTYRRAWLQVGRESTAA